MLSPRPVGRLVALAAGLASLALLSGGSAPGGHGVAETDVAANARQRPAAALSDAVRAPEQPGPARAAGSPRPTHTASPDQSSAGGERVSSRVSVAPPSVLRIGAVGIEAPVVSTDTDEHGVLQVPPPEQVGWFERWPAPGDPGAAIIAGHVDSRSGPGALFALEQVRPGMTVQVERQDGTTVSFRVERIETHAKDRFPTQAVYGDVPDAQLRLITCTGPFDPEARQYRDNLVVYATADSGN